MRPQDLLAESVLACKTLCGRYFVGFDDTTHTKQPPGLPNHLAWSLGHLAHTMHRVAEKLDGRDIPGSDFVVPPTVGSATVGAPPSPPTAFDMESIRFGSTPRADPKLYPTTARCIDIFDNACDRLAAAARAASDAKLSETVTWGQGQTTLHALVQRMVFHNGTHTGQIADLRRALGFKSIFA